MVPVSKYQAPIITGESQAPLGSANTSVGEGERNEAEGAIWNILATSIYVGEGNILHIRPEKEPSLQPPGLYGFTRIHFPQIPKWAGILFLPILHN